MEVMKVNKDTFLVCWKLADFVCGGPHPSVSVFTHSTMCLGSTVLHYPITENWGQDLEQAKIKALNIVLLVPFSYYFLLLLLGFADWSQLRPSNVSLGDPLRFQNCRLTISF